MVIYTANTIRSALYETVQRRNWAHLARGRKMKRGWGNHPKELTERCRQQQKFQFEEGEVLGIKLKIASATHSQMLKVTSSLLVLSDLGKMGNPPSFVNDSQELALQSH
jgi:hypothetical protein